MSELLALLFLIVLVFLSYYLIFVLGLGLSVASWPYLITGFCLYVVVSSLISHIVKGNN